MQFFQSDKELLKKLATKDCELKKMEAANRRYQVATETLQKFVEVRIQIPHKSKV